MKPMKNNKTYRKENQESLYQSQKQKISRYTEGYKHNPETKEEIEITRQAASTILSENS
jgi:hypothetical protein